MIGLHTLLGAVIGAELGLMVEAGLGEELRSIKKRMAKENGKAREEAFSRALEHASKTSGLKELDALLTHDPFREALVAGLLDPMEGFDIRSASELYKGELPAQALSLGRFLKTLEDARANCWLWRPVRPGSGAAGPRDRHWCKPGWSCRHQ